MSVQNDAFTRLFNLVFSQKFQLLSFQDMILANRFCYCMSLRAGCFILSIISLFVCSMHIYNFNVKMGDNQTNSDSVVFPEGATQILFRLMPEFLTIIAVFFLLTALTTNLIHLILITLTFEVTQLLYQFLYSIIATALNINVTVRMGVYSSTAYWGFISCWIVFSAYFVYIILSYYQKTLAMMQHEVSY
ncbi:uncharacterized protein LOC108152510 isoform X2 [Drosophila miranda]|uniref:uncharacterized protein LOC108152510 isoform X2 n=1 Tax=Drosophila miranda TaxID=7229 RepID=UPI00143F0D82|nr:uncharacterized protein LOC108152510 isoform X2 [Drosophila miranda]